MNLRDYIAEVATTFDRSAPMSAPAQQLLRSAASELGTLPPTGYITTGSGGRGNPAKIPWFGFLNPDETVTPLDGLYVVYLFSGDLERVFLTLIQGVTHIHDNVHPPEAARARLRNDGARLRAELKPAELEGLLTSIDLGASGQLPSGYKAGAVAALEYGTDDLPDETALRRDLARIIDLYEDAIRAKRRILLSDPGAILSPSATTSSEEPGPTFDHFKPKDASDYTTQVTGGTFIRTRRHEALIAAYGNFARTSGLSPSTARHPIDLVVTSNGSEWIIEGEVVKHGNAAHAVREAIGQLFEYREFLYRAVGRTDPHLVALFSEPIGDAFQSLLATLGIEVVWSEDGEWRGSQTAVEGGLTN